MDNLSNTSGIGQVTASPQTGRITVRHDGDLTEEAAGHRIDDILADAAMPRLTPTRFPAAAPHESGGVVSVAAPPAPSAHDWHALGPDAVLDLLEGGTTGLTRAEAARRLAIHGPNALPEPVPPSRAAMMARQFTSLPVILLLGSATLSVATGGVFDAVVTLAVVAANAAIGYSTESMAERTILSLTRRSDWPVRVCRDDHVQSISSAEIVPGDVLLLEAGVVLPADARVIAADDLKVNEALLTGESEPDEKGAAPVEATAPLAAQSSMVRRGTFVASGSGTAVVVATGIATEIGRIEAEAVNVRPPPTILEKDLGQLGLQLTGISAFICVGVFALGTLRGRPLLQMMRSSMALAVAAVPEGLPAISTSALALELRRLKTKDVMARRLHAVEGLGALTTVCFDKTGTLTANDMSVSWVGLGDGTASSTADDNGDAAPGDDLRRLLEIGVLCSDVAIEETVEGCHLSGSGTEKALIALALHKGLNARQLRMNWPRADARLRRADRRMMATFHRQETEDSTVVAAKGDPRSVLGRCATIRVGDETLPLTEESRRDILERTDEAAARGLRVLGLAYSENAAPADWFDAPLAWAGAVGLSNPVRPGGRELIADLQAAGIRTQMITGDQSATARTVATDLGLSGDEPLQILDTSDLSSLPPDLLSALCRQTHVFARVSPSQKLDIVKALQAEGEVVGMTGDGFNDAPAMKAADVAIALGKDSAGAARDVADIVIDGAHLRRLADGIAHGRTVRTNVRKTVHFMMSTNLSEILVVTAETILGRPGEVEAPLELLWLNLVTDVLPGLGLALEPPERQLMTRPPDRKSHLFTGEDIRQSLLESLVMTGATLGAHGIGLGRYGAGPQTRALTLYSLIGAILMHSYSCRADSIEDLPERSFFSNGALNAGTGGAFALQAMPLLVPGFRRLLGLGRLSLFDLLVAAGAGLGSFATIETIKSIRTPPKTLLPIQGDPTDA